MTPFILDEIKKLKAQRKIVIALLTTLNIGIIGFFIYASVQNFLLRNTEEGFFEFCWSYNYWNPDDIANRIATINHYDISQISIYDKSIKQLERIICNIVQKFLQIKT